MPDIQEKIYNTLLQRIESGVYSPGSKMATERNLAVEFATTLWCIHTAMNRLEDCGFIERRRYFGTFVVKNLQRVKVQKQRNRNSKTVVCIVARNFYYVKFGHADVIGDFERIITTMGYTVIYEDMPENDLSLKHFLAKYTEAKAIVFFPELLEMEFLHSFCLQLSQFAGEIYYYNRGLVANDVLPFNSAGIDILHGGRMAADWVIKNGFEHTAFMALNSFNSYWLEQRIAGVKCIFQDSVRQIRMFWEKNPESLFVPVEEFIKQCSKPPAIMAAHDELAAAVYEYLESKKIIAGRDYIMVSFDNHPYYRHLNLINVAWPLDRVGEILASAVAQPEMIRPHELCTIKIQLKPCIIERGTIPDLTNEHH